MCISTINEKTKTEIIRINMLLVTEANIIAKVTSAADNGAYKVSIIFPWIFAIINEEIECEKLCWTIDITIRPGAKKTINGKPSTAPLSLPIANVRTVKNNKLETSGDRIVWAHTTRKRLISFK